MDQLIARIANALNIDAALAENALGAALGFLQKEGPPAEMERLLAGIPGAQDMINLNDGASGGLMGALGGLFGAGGLMGLAMRLQGMGLGMDQIQALGEQLLTAAREQLGEEAVSRIVAEIPGLDRFA